MAAVDLYCPLHIRPDQRRADPCAIFETVTPSDDTDLRHLTCALYVGGAGDLVVQDVGGGVSIFRGVPAGTVLPIRVARIRATAPGSPTIATTASNMIAMT